MTFLPVVAATGNVPSRRCQLFMDMLNPFLPSQNLRMNRNENFEAMIWRSGSRFSGDRLTSPSKTAIELLYRAGGRTDEFAEDLPDHRVRPAGRRDSCRWSKLMLAMSGLTR